MKIPFLLMATISLAYSQTHIDQANSTVGIFPISQQSIACASIECLDKAGMMDIYLLDEEVVRQLLIQVVQATLNGNNWKQHWQIITYLTIFMVFFSVIGICICTLQRKIRKKMIYFFRFIHYRSTYQTTATKLKLFILLSLFAATVYLSYFALHKSESIQPALNNTLKIFEQGSYAAGNYSLLVSLGEGQSQFHEDLMSYQFSLNRVKTKCNHLIGYHHLEDLELAVESASKILPNNTFLELLENETNKILAIG